MFNNFRAIEITKRAFPEPLQMEHNPRAFSPEPEPIPNPGFGNNAFKGYNPQSSIPPGYEPIEDFKAPHPNWAPQGYPAHYFHPKPTPAPVAPVAPPKPSLAPPKPITGSRPGIKTTRSGADMKGFTDAITNPKMTEARKSYVPGLHKVISDSQRAAANGQSVLKRDSGNQHPIDDAVETSLVNYMNLAGSVGSKSVLQKQPAPAATPAATDRRYVTPAGDPMKRSIAGFNIPVADEYGNATGKTQPLFKTPQGIEGINQIKSEIAKQFPNLNPEQVHQVAISALNNTRLAHEKNVTIGKLPQILETARRNIQTNSPNAYYQKPYWLGTNVSVPSRWSSFKHGLSNGFMSPEEQEKFDSSIVAAPIRGLGRVWKYMTE